MIWSCQSNPKAASSSLAESKYFFLLSFSPSMIQLRLIAACIPPAALVGQIGTESVTVGPGLYVLVIVPQVRLLIVRMTTQRFLNQSFFIYNHALLKGKL